MKKQLEAFTQEMLKEITDLKDLAKSELPEVAKEYIRYNIVINTFILSLMGFGFLFSIFLVLFGLLKDYQHVDIYGTLGGIGIGIFGFFSIVATVELLQFKLQPRRMAIKAITSLF